MQIHRLNQHMNPQFGAIFKITKDSSNASETVIETVKECTNDDEAAKIKDKFNIGGGSLYVYVPNENLDNLKKLLNRRIVSNSTTEYITKID